MSELTDMPGFREQQACDHLVHTDDVVAMTQRIVDLEAQNASLVAENERLNLLLIAAKGDTIACENYRATIDRGTEQIAALTTENERLKVHLWDKDDLLTKQSRNHATELQLLPLRWNEDAQVFVVSMGGILSQGTTRDEAMAAGHSAVKLTVDALTESLRVANLEVERLKGLVNTPQLYNFMEAVKVEAVHQRERWGSQHDGGKSPEDWLWLVGYLATKATQASRYNDFGKYLHHIITCAAACLNWHANASGDDTAMRPGIDPAKYQ